MNDNRNPNSIQNYQSNMGQPLVQNQSKKNNNKSNLFIIIILVVLFIGIFYFINKDKSKNLSKESDIPNISEDNNTTNDNASNNNEETFSDVMEKYEEKYDKNGPFLMVVEDVSDIAGRGTVVTGRIKRGQINIGDGVEIVGIKETKKTVVTEIEMFKKQLDYAEKGDNVGILLNGIAPGDIEPGQVLSQPNSISATKKFEGEITVLNKNQGGKGSSFELSGNYQVYLSEIKIPAKITLVNGKKMVNPGDVVNISVELDTPVAMEVGTMFLIYEDFRSICLGKITKMN